MRVGEAWVFPVGIKDAVWFAFRNENINVYQMSSATDALNYVKAPTDRVYEFDPSGELIEKKKKTKTAVIVP